VRASTSTVVVANLISMDGAGPYTTTMALASGTRLGGYEIHGLLGQGGMGEVYLARDSRLPRDVAIKRVRQADGGGPAGRARLVREATILAQLTHPNICTLYELVEDGDQAYLAMEALQGESLAARLARNPGKGLPIATVLTIGAQVAEGLAFAHGRGVIHQDIKPANILLTPAGAKILDFGIARLRELSEPTARTATATADDLARAGTLPYMAPEQLDGRADARSDIFALGAMLYEMLSGHRAFEGDSTASIVERLVDARRPALPAGDHPPGLVRLVDKCLATEPHERWQSAADLADELRWIAKQPDGTARRSASPQRHRSLTYGLLVAGVMGLAILAASAWTLWPTASSPSPLHADMALPLDLRLAYQSPPALSPDGRFLAFAASHEGVQRLYLRDLTTGDLREIAGTDGAVQPFWSPDGMALAFFADRSLKRVARDGGQPLTLAPAGLVPLGGDWSRDDVIVFTAEYVEGTLWRVAASGGVRSVVARPDRSAQDQSLSWPRFLPDGRTLLYLRDNGQQDRDALMARSLDRDDATVVEGVTTSATFVAPGTLLYARNGWLVAHAFDAERRQVSGEARPVAGPVETYDNLGMALSAPSIERLIYRSPRVPVVQLAWMARDGRVLDVVGRPEVGLFNIKLGARGTRVIGQIEAEGQSDLWLWDLARGTRDRVTATQDWEVAPVLSPDGQRVAFEADGRGTFDLYVRNVGGPDDRQLLAAAGDSALWPSDWSADGRLVVGTGLRATTQQDVWAFSFESSVVSWLYRTPAREGVPRLSPNGRWVAYQSDEDGRFDVFVAAWSSPGNRRKITTRGGVQPRWRADGRELFFLEPDGSVHAVTLNEQGDRLVPGPATRLFGSTALKPMDPWSSRYDVTPDGSRFLIAQDVPSSSVEGFKLITGWQPAASRR
jgi:serine/threonine protein kinase/Tol biopolymer transport system component